MISDLYLGTSRRTRPLPRGVAGHVAHPIRSIQISDLWGFRRGERRSNVTLHPCFGLDSVSRAGLPSAEAFHGMSNGITWRPCLR